MTCAIAYAGEGADIVTAYLTEDDDAAEVKIRIKKDARPPSSPSKMTLTISSPPVLLGLAIIIGTNIPPAH